MTAPDVTVVEVGPRDGLQNEREIVPLDAKRALVEALDAAGLRRMEVGSFVSPRWVPQMADTSALLQTLGPLNARTSVLVPNRRGLEAALTTSAREIVVFAAATETFSKRNINCGVAEAAERLTDVIIEAKRQGRSVRVDISCATHCPYEGPVAPGVVADLSARLMAAGGDELALCDTIGKATPKAVKAVIEAAKRSVPARSLAWHGHDTYGQALVNVLAALEADVRIFDSSVTGLGGCPFAPGAAGNLATEDLVYLLAGEGLTTGVDLDRLLAAGRAISAVLGRPPTSRVARALH